MKAAAIHEHGDVDVVRVEDIPEPGPASGGEVVVDVRAAALNHLDVWVCKGRPGMSIDGPHTIGSDGAGVVSEVGPGVEGVSAGDEVVINPALACGKCEFCLRGEQSECSSFGLVGLSRPGAFAEKVSVPARCVRPKPAHLSFEEAAAFTLAHLTAWRMLMTRARLVPGETVLIHGIGGGVALAGLQIAKLLQARVIVTSSSDEKLERARKLGADEIVNYRKNEHVAKKVRDLTGGRGVDVAFDSVGAAGIPIDVAAVRRGGRIVLCGITTGAAVEINLQAVYWNQISLLGSTMGSDDDFLNLVKTVASSSLKPVIDSVHPLADVQKALRRMVEGKQFGKIVLKVSE